MSADAKTYAKIYSVYASDQTHSFLINGKTTGDFVMSSSSVKDALDKINAISGTTGVTATATDANEVLLYSQDGSDILVENQKAVTSLRMKTVGFNGTTEVKKLAVHAKKTDNADLTASTLHNLKNLTTGANTAFTTTGTQNAAVYDGLINSALSATVGTKATRVSTSDLTSIAAGDYFLKHAPTGDVYRLTVATTDASGWTGALSGATLVGGDHDTVARSLADEVSVSINGTFAAQKLQLTGSRLFGDFDVFSDQITSLNIMNTAHASHRAGIEGTGVEVTTTSSGASGAIIATQIAGSAAAAKQQ